MANELSVSQIVSEVALAKFVTAAPFIVTAARTYQDEFERTAYKTGDTLQVRTQNQFLVGDGRIANPQSVLETTVPLTISHQYHTEFEFTSRELTLDVNTSNDKFNDRYITPAIRNIVAQMEKDIALQALTELNYIAGTAGSTINTFAAVENVRALMGELAMPYNEGAYAALTERDSSALRGALQNAFNPTLNEDISFYSQLGHLSVFDLFSSQSIARQTAGSGSTASTLKVDGAVASGSTINIKDATASTSGIINVGDVITIAGVNSVNPVNRMDTGYSMSFTVLTTEASDGSGDLTITVSPEIIGDIASPRRNIVNPSTPTVSATIPDSAVITLIGAGTTYNNNIAYTSRALELVLPPMEKIMNTDSWVQTDPDYNVSLRVMLQGSAWNDVNMCRIDVLSGFRWNNQYGVRLLS
jgi:hypothetical protein